MNRRQYLTGTGSLVAAGALGSTETGRAQEGAGETGRAQEGAGDAGQSTGRSGQPLGPAARTLLHLSSGDPTDQEMALMNAKNLLADETVINGELRFVTNAKGIYALVEAETEHAELVASLSEAGVDFTACENAMGALDVSESDLLPDVDPVPSGVGDIAKREAEGYGYIKVP